MSIIPKGFGCTSHKIFSKHESNNKSVHRSLTKHYKIKSSLDKSKIKNYKKTTEILEIPNKDIANIVNVNCSICLNNIHNAATLISCQHAFCFECIESWFKLKKICPLCKSPETCLVRCSNESDLTIWRLVEDNDKILPPLDTGNITNIELVISKHKNLIHLLNAASENAT